MYIYSKLWFFGNRGNARSARVVVACEKWVTVECRGHRLIVDRETLKGTFDGRQYYTSREALREAQDAHGKE